MRRVLLRFRSPGVSFLKAGNGNLRRSVTEEADNEFLSHSTGLFLDNSLPSFQENAPRGGKKKTPNPLEPLYSRSDA